MRHRYDIFLSYRRSNGREIARTIKESLTRLGYKVFLDYDALQDGVFDHRILSAIEDAPVYIIILTEHCLDRCTNPDDWVRQELEHALATHRIIVPIIPDSRFSTIPSEVPESIRVGLGQHQYSSIDTGQLYQASIEQLDINRLRPVLRKSYWRKVVVSAILALATSLAIYGGYSYHTSHSIPNKLFLSALDFASITSPSYNPDTAFIYFTRAYERGHIQAIAHLGVCHEEGIGTPINLSEAIRLYREGYAHNDAYATYRLGRCMRDGVGLNRDYIEGVRLILQSASNGDVFANLDMPQGRWIFSPTCDSTYQHEVALRAICRFEDSLVVHMRWLNSRHFGGWISVNPDTYITITDNYPLSILSATIPFSPDTLSVPFGSSIDFSLTFPSLPDTAMSFSLHEPTPSDWQWWGIQIR